MMETTLGRNGEIPATIYTDSAQLAQTLADYILANIAQAAKEGRTFYLGCPTGRSPFETYQEMGRRAGKRQQSLSHLVLVMMDDYVLPTADGGFEHCPADAHYSCRRFVYEDMQDVFNAGLPEEKQLKRENIWFPNPGNPAAYDQRIAEAGGVDLFIVASGASDGHIAFNPVGTSADSPSRIIELAEETRTDNLGTFPEFQSLEDVPKHGISIGLKSICEQSKQIVLIIHGEHKQTTVERLNALDSFCNEWPVSIVFNAAGTVSAWMDEAAATKMFTTEHTEDTE